MLDTLQETRLFSRSLRTARVESGRRMKSKRQSEGAREGQGEPGVQIPHLDLRLQAPGTGGLVNS